jgi:hypothetical protein
MIWGNVLNFRAVARATQLYFQWLATGERVAWAKTAHAFPTEAHLREFKRKLGDLLLENRLLSLQHLQHAMEVQKQTGERLGDVLTRLGYVNEDELVPVLGAQLQVESRHIDTSRIRRDLLRLVPETVARELQIIPVSNEGGTLVVAAADPGSPATKNWVEQNLKPPVQLVLAGRQNLREAIDRAYAPAAPRMLLGELLLKSGVITGAQLERALELQQQTGRRLGEVLESMGLVTPELLAAKIREQQLGTIAA